jgi:AmmeMemoRadiSam system protein A
MESRGSLEETIAACAVAAATADPRFPPLRAEELPEVAIEISLLDSPIPASGPEDIVVGTHGIIVRRGARRGLLLPQVGAETGWTAVSLLDQAALKAGLPEDAWRSGASIEIFTAEIFSEAGRPVPHGS